MTLLELENVTKIYRTGEVEVKALRGITIKIDDKSYCAIVGPSGSGKTTFLNLVGCLDLPSSGSLKVLGTEVGRLNFKKRALFRGENLGFIFQDFNLIPTLTAYENVEYPLVMVKNMPLSERHKKIMYLLEEIGIPDQKDKFPTQLSGGQKQRVAIARALATDPKIVLADEPTANLDHKAAFQIINLMKKIKEELGTTFIFSTHDQKIIRSVDFIYYLEDGVIQNVKKQENTNA